MKFLRLLMLFSVLNLFNFKIQAMDLREASDKHIEKFISDLYKTHEIYKKRGKEEEFYKMLDNASKDLVEYYKEKTKLARAEAEIRNAKFEKLIADSIGDSAYLKELTAALQKSSIRSSL